MLLGSKIPPFKKPAGIVVADHYAILFFVADKDTITLAAEVKIPKEVRTDRPGVSMRTGRGGRLLASGSSPFWGNDSEKDHHLEHVAKELVKLVKPRTKNLETLALCAPADIIERLALMAEKTLGKKFGKKIRGTFVKLHPKKIAAMVLSPKFPT